MWDAVRGRAPRPGTPQDDGAEGEHRGHTTHTRPWAPPDLASLRALRLSGHSSRAVTFEGQFSQDWAACVCLEPPGGRAGISPRSPASKPDRAPSASFRIYCVTDTREDHSIKSLRSMAIPSFERGLICTPSFPFCPQIAVTYK